MHPAAFKVVTSPKQLVALVLSVAACLGAVAAHAQSSSLLWRTNLGATLFAVDAQARAYANAGGNVIVVNAAGEAISTNVVCPVAGIARRDGDGSYWFAGSFDGTQDFGGITLVGGWTNWGAPPQWTPGWPTCFLAKYNSGGTLQWVTPFGTQSYNNSVDDLLLDAGGTCYVAFRQSATATMARFADGGSRLWEKVGNVTENPFGLSQGIILGGLTASNCTYVNFAGDGLVFVGRLDQSGNRTGMSASPLLLLHSPASIVGHPVGDDLARPVVVSGCLVSCPEGNKVMRKYDLVSGAVWERIVPLDVQWTLARDAQANIYVSGPNGTLAKYDTEGFLVWSNNWASPTVSMVVNQSGVCLLSFADGSVARLVESSPLQILQPRWQGGSFAFAVSAYVGASLTVRSSTNLTHWTELLTTNLTTAVVEFTDPTAGQSPQKFYQASAGP